MDINFQAVIAKLGLNFAFRLINAARAPQSNVWATCLPEENKTTYDVKTGEMTVRSTMAGLVAMGSEYPETGLVNTSDFMERTAKIANRVRFGESALRELQNVMNALQLGGGNTAEALTEEVLNFQNALLTQPHLDTMEYLRGQAMTTGQLNWTFGTKTLTVDYGIPVANKLAQRTGTAGYGGSGSTFWADIRAARKLLRYNVQRFITHPDTMDMILFNDANKLNIIAQTDSSVTVQRYRGANEQGSTDSRDTVTFVLYGDEAEVFDPANVNATKKLPFCPPGGITAIGNSTVSTYRVGQGSRVPTPLELGYTHIAPTVEGGGVAGRWSRVYTSEKEPWMLIGEAVTNGLPVIESPERIVLLNTAMA